MIESNKLDLSTLNDEDILVFSMVGNNGFGSKRMTVANAKEKGLPDDFEFSFVAVMKKNEATTKM